MDTLGAIPFTKEYEEYLKDESRKSGNADSMSFPKTEEDVRAVVTAMRKAQIPVTVQGARTGITAGACPNGGHILNLSLMNQITGLRYDDHKNIFFLIVQPGALLSKINETVSQLSFDTDCWSEESLGALALMKNAGRFFFPPDPTETSASIGGMAACNASGACSFYYGPTRLHIEALRAVISDGSVIHLRRGVQKAYGNEFAIKTNTGKDLKGRLPDYKMPEVKNASGYYAKEDMDIIDLFIGSEGTLGIITEIEIRLSPEPKFKYSLMAFLPSEDITVEFVTKIRNESVKMAQARMTEKLVAIEYFNEKTLDLLRDSKKNIAAFSGIPEISPSYNSAVYIEYHGDDESTLEDLMISASELLEQCGGDENATWMGMDKHGMEKMKYFRHAVPEAVNILIDQRRKSEPGISKLSTDLAVPDACLKEVLRMYHTGLEAAGMDYVIFGHIGNNHVHVNILPRTLEDYSQGYQLYLQWAREVISMGGTVSAEHGIGKLKTSMLMEMYGEAGVAQMRSLKRCLDPEGLFNRGNMFHWM